LATSWTDHLCLVELDGRCYYCVPLRGDIAVADGKVFCSFRKEQGMPVYVQPDYVEAGSPNAEGSAQLTF
jgi:hypothetical protein